MSVAYIIVLLFVAAYAADEDCNCENMIEVDEKLLLFLKNLSVDVPPEDSDLFSVVPGMLSPLVQCDCDDFTRQKRRATSDESQEVPEELQNAEKAEVPDIPESAQLREKKSIHNDNVHTRNCPRGYRRFGFMCVSDDYSDE